MNIINVGYDSTNYYVIEINRRHILIDVGWPGTLPKLLANLKRKGLTFADVDYLLVTHFHPDHAGLVQELKRKGVKHLLLDVQLAGIPLLKTYMKPDSGYVDILPDNSLHLAVRDSRPWLAHLGFHGEVTGTPGHSDDSVSLVLDEGAAFTGDLLPPMLVSGGEVEKARQSWAKLRALHAKTIYPGHGPVRPFE
jgi:ribonuclease/clavin/mitogillin